ncbi:hypothetical protein [Echinicola sediminis]
MPKRWYGPIKNCWVLLLWLLIGCSSNGREQEGFKVSFDHENFLEENDSFYSGDLSVWKVKGGKLICLVSKNNQYLMMKNFQMREQKRKIVISTKLGFYNRSIAKSGGNWVGFCIGCGNEGDVPFNPIGLKAGISTNGSVFIGEPSADHVTTALLSNMDQELGLEMNVSSDGITNAVSLKVMAASSGKTLAHISKRDISSRELEGMIGLVSDFDHHQALENFKSVYFTDWEISGETLKD